MSVSEPGRSTRRWLPTALGGAAVAALVWTSTLPGAWGPGSSGGQEDASGPAGTSAGEGQAPAFVEDAALACAGVEGLTGQASAAVAPQELVSATGDGEGRLRVLSGGSVADQVSLPSAGAATAALDAGGSALITATGSAVPGLVAGQLLVGTGGGADPASPTGDEQEAAPTPAARGLALSGCVEPGEEHWLLAGGAAPGRTESLVLTNPGADPVRVDLELRGQDGPAEVTGGAGLVVPPDDQLAVPVDALAAGVEAPALGVSAEGGPVAAQLVETVRDGTTDLGLSISSPSAAPARDLVVPAVPGDVERQDLVLRVLAPDGPAVVELVALTEAGAATPEAAAVRVEAGSTTDVPLEGLPEGPVGLRLRSDAPVTASLQVRVAPSGDDPIEADAAASTDDQAASTDDAASSSAPPSEDGTTVVRPAGDLTWLPSTALSAQPVGAAVPAAEVPDARWELSLTVLDATTAQVLLLSEDAGVSTRTVELAHDSSTVLDLPQGTAAVWVRPAEVDLPPVSAALHVTGQDELGPYRAATTLRPVPWTRAVADVSSVIP